MKFLYFIFIFYIFILSAIPCCAFDSCPDDKTELAERHESGDEDCGNCSPFFSCEGCATATVAFEPGQFEIFTAPLLSVYTGYIQNSLPQINHDFWQPPKIS